MAANATVRRQAITIKVRFQLVCCSSGGFCAVSGSCGFGTLAVSACCDDEASAGASDLFGSVLIDSLAVTAIWMSPHSCYARAMASTLGDDAQKSRYCCIHLRAISAYMRVPAEGIWHKVCTQLLLLKSERNCVVGLRAKNSADQGLFEHNGRSATPLFREEGDENAQRSFRHRLSRFCFGLRARQPLAELRKHLKRSTWTLEITNP